MKSTSFILALILLLFFSGCYTQLLIEEPTSTVATNPINTPTEPILIPAPPPPSPPLPIVIIVTVPLSPSSGVVNPHRPTGPQRTDPDRTESASKHRPTGDGAERGRR